MEHVHRSAAAAARRAGFALGALALGACGALAQGPGPERPPGRSAPRQIGPPLRVDARGLYDYINGAAEVYLLHGFRGLEVRTYAAATSGGPEVRAEIFDLGSPAGAYGAFSHARDLEGEPVAVGAEGHYQAGVLWSWKGRHLVCVSARSGKASRQVLAELATALNHDLPGGAARPGLVDALPGRGLRARTVRYFRAEAALAYHYGEIDAKLLALRGGAEAVLADYRRTDGAAVLLLVRYPAVETAREALERVRAGYLGGGGAEASPRPRDRWAAAARVEAVVLVVLEAASEDAARSLLDEARAAQRRSR